MTQDRRAEQHPDFPNLPDYCPFTYAVLALACMAPVPGDRPPFFQVFEVLSSLDAELASGSYVDWAGQTRVRHRMRCRVLHAVHDLKWQGSAAASTHLPPEFSVKLQTDSMGAYGLGLCAGSVRAGRADKGCAKGAHRA